MSSSRTTFPHYDLGSGLVETLNRVHEPQLKDELDRAITASHETRNVFPIGAGKLEVIADLTTITPEATACFYVSAGAPLGDGRVPVGTILYQAITAHWIATAPDAYRFLLARYLSAVSSGPPLTCWNAPGFMPRAAPFLCGFSSSEAESLSGDEKRLLWKLTRLIGLNLLERCERSAEELERDGNAPQPDPGRYPELGNLDD